MHQRKIYRDRIMMETCLRVKELGFYPADQCFLLYEYGPSIIHIRVT